MRGDEALMALPIPYVWALHLASGGATDEEIADALGVVEASVPVLLLLGATKLQAALIRPRRPTA